MVVKGSEKRDRRKARQRRVRKRVRGTPERPRLSVFKSSKHIYAQIINDMDGHTLAAASSLSQAFRSQQASGGNIDGAKLVGKLVAEEALQKGIRKVVFDRNGFLYHGRVKALADAAREAGLEF
ncbi:MAG: 50S ribosomal protein L18 [Nitrospinota bacterium]|nr:MAG: 50S ribosomal protein L18 [Nitrospinota bacterium]